MMTRHLHPTRSLAALRQHGRRGQRGSAMIITIILMLCIAVIAISVISFVGTALQMSQKRRDTTEAFNMADAGIELGRLWLTQQSAPPSISALQFTNNFYGTNGTISDPFNTGASNPPTLTVRIDADTDNSNTNNTQKRYLIESKAIMPSGVTQTDRAYVQQSSFGHYAVFVNGNPSGAYWSNDQLVFDGPVHSNNSDGGSPAQADGPSNIIVWHSEAGASPIFTYNAPDAFTVSGPAVTYNKDGYSGYGSSTPPTTETDWQKIATYGSAGIRVGTPMINFPPTGSDQTLLHDRALGSNATPTATGVTIEPGGGVYIHCKNSSSTSVPAPSPNNDVQTMTLGLDGSGNQTITVVQTSDSGAALTTLVTLDQAHNQTKVSVNGGAATVTSGTTNGIVYCDGNIGNQNGCDGATGPSSAAKTGGLSGTVADHQSMTIATDPTKNCNILDNIKYKTARATSGGSPIPESSDSNFTTNAGTLGIVSNNVEVMDNNASSVNITNIEVDAAVFAYGTYDAVDYFNRPLGQMLNMGSYLVGTRGIFASPTNGIPCSRLYDNRLGVTPPPFFPTTSNQYEVVSWQRGTDLL